MSWSRVFTQLSQLKLLSHVIKVLVLAMLVTQFVIGQEKLIASNHKLPSTFYFFFN